MMGLLSGSRTEARPAAPSGTPTADRLALAACGLASAGIYLFVSFGLPAGNTAGQVGAFLGTAAALFALQAGAATVVLRRPLRGALPWILGCAALFRLLILPAGLPQQDPIGTLVEDLTSVDTAYESFLIYDNDVWRYLWDGHVGASGLDPWERTPAEWRAAAQRSGADLAPLESDLWWSVLERTSFHGYTTVYLPVAQLLFRLAHAVAPGSVFVWKALVAALDLAACLLLVSLLRALGRPDETVILYAWSPLAILELPGSGHVDAAVVLSVVAFVALLARGRGMAAQGVLALGILVKPTPLVLAPLLWGRVRPSRLWVLPAVLAAGLWPMAGSLPKMAGGLAAYAREWIFNAGPWQALRWGADVAGVDDPVLWAHVTSRLVLVAVVARETVLRRPGAEGLVRSAFTALAALILLHSAVMPWYVVWALPLAVAARRRWWLAFSAACLLSYTVYIDGTERPLWIGVEYALVGAAWLLERARTGSR